MKKLLLGLLILPVLAGCGSSIDIPKPAESVNEETVVANSFVDVELDNWDDIGLHIIYNKDNEGKILDDNAEEKYNRAKRLAETAEKAVKIYFKELENDFIGKNKETMDAESYIDDLGDVRLKELKALESFTYDENYTGIYVAAMIDVSIDSNPVIKEVLFEVAFNGEEIEDFRLRDTNMDGTGSVEIFSPDEAYYGIDKETGRIKKFNR